MKTYTLTLYSPAIHNWIIFAGVVAGMSGFVLAMIFNYSYISCISILAVPVIISKLLALKLYKATGEFTISDNGLALRWIEQFGVSTHPDYHFVFNDLREYTIEARGENGHTGETYSLSILMKDGKRVSFAFKKNKKDDSNFAVFLADFQKTISSYNKKNGVSGNHIQSGPTFWESSAAKIISGILVSGIIGVWLYALTNEHVQTKIPRLVLLTVAVALYAGKVIVSSRKKRDT